MKLKRLVIGITVAYIIGLGGSLDLFKITAGEFLTYTVKTIIICLASLHVIDILSNHFDRKER